MPRYHFNVRDGHSTPDTEGLECADDDAARIEAAHFAGKILQDSPDLLWTEGSWMVDVTDEKGVSQFAVVVTAIRSPDPEDV